MPNFQTFLRASQNLPCGVNTKFRAVSKIRAREGGGVGRTTNHSCFTQHESGSRCSDESLASLHGWLLVFVDMFVFLRASSHARRADARRAPLDGAISGEPPCARQLRAMCVAASCYLKRAVPMFKVVMGRSCAARRIAAATMVIYKPTLVVAAELEAGWWHGPMVDGLS